MTQEDKRTRTQTLLQFAESVNMSTNDFILAASVALVEVASLTSPPGKNEMRIVLTDGSEVIIKMPERGLIN